MKKRNQVSITKIKNRNVTKSTKKIVTEFKTEIDQYFDVNGFVSFSTKSKKYIILGTNSPKQGICECPECHIGQLSVIKSVTTKKRFIGCSNYQNGCKASAPLLQKAMLKVLKTKCSECHWPTVIFRYSRKQEWKRQCANMKCKTRS